MINNFLMTIVLFAAVTACNSSKQSSSAKVEEKRPLRELVEITPESDVDSIDPGDEYIVVINPKEKVKLSAEAKGFSILLGHMNLDTKKLTKDVFETEEWHFVAKNADHYEIKITIIDEDGSEEVFFKSFQAKERENTEEASEDAEQDDSYEDSDAEIPTNDTENSPKHTTKQPVISEHPNQKVMDLMTLDGHNYIFERNGVKLLLEKSLIEGRISTLNCAATPGI